MQIELKSPYSLVQLKLMSWSKQIRRVFLQGFEATDDIERPQQIPPRYEKGRRVGNDPFENVSKTHGGDPFRQFMERSSSMTTHFWKLTNKAQKPNVSNRNVFFLRVHFQVPGWFSGVYTNAPCKTIWNSKNEGLVQMMFLFISA